MNVIERLSFGATPYQNGQLCVYRNFAALDWHEVKDALPEIEDVNLLIDYGGTDQRLAVFYQGKFTNRNHSSISQPKRWAYVRTVEEIWDGNKWVLPDGTAPPVAEPGTIPGPLQRHVDGLKMVYTTRQILDAMDRSPYDQPEEGAPE